MSTLSRCLLACLAVTLGMVNCHPSILMAQAPSAQTWAQRGIDAAQRRDWQRAVEAFTEALRLDPNYAVAHYNRCVAVAAHKAKRMGPQTAPISARILCK